MITKKVIVITGASSGIGETTAKALSQSPHMVVLMARNIDKLKELSGSLDCLNLAMQVDVTDVSQVQSAFEKVVQTFGGVDVLINNAGLGCFDPIDQGKLKEWHTMIDVNLKGLLNCLHSALPSLKKSDDGQIINVASVAAHNVYPNSGVYSATKHAVLAISKSLQMELANQLKVTTISPGPVNTPFVEQTSNNSMKDSLRDYFAGGLEPVVIAEQIINAIEQPKNVAISEIIVRPKRMAK